ncbi:hypothetical protein ACGFR6_27835 [Streptomyces sp. NPDC048567]|uniref:hypothetical protein n=1 Tax=Streptomyces sp. NPDC048567 TaxID=3365570 RepID=UPI0037144679
MVDMWDLDSEAIEKRVAFRTQVRDLVWRETKKRMSSLGFSEQEGPATPNALTPTSAAAKAVHLAYLEVATEVGEAARDLAIDAAARAGRAGASYSDLGAASGITRQAARKRWPAAVGTHWALYLLTGKSSPRGMTVRVLRSEDKAIETGRTAVDEGALAEDGAVGAVVINAAREAVWACYFDGGAFAPQEVALPEELLAVPAPDSPEHGNWLHKFDQFIAHNI